MANNKIRRLGGLRYLQVTSCQERQLLHDTVAAICGTGKGLDERSLHGGLDEGMKGEAFNHALSHSLGSLKIGSALWATACALVLTCLLLPAQLHPLCREDTDPHRHFRGFLTAVCPASCTRTANLCLERNFAVACIFAKYWRLCRISAAKAKERHLHVIYHLLISTPRTIAFRILS